MEKKQGILKADSVGDFHLYRPTGLCYHYDEDCDGSCQIADERGEIDGFEPTNALLPAIQCARALGYEDARGEWQAREIRRCDIFARLGDEEEGEEKI